MVSIALQQMKLIIIIGAVFQPLAGIVYSILVERNMGQHGFKHRGSYLN
jgi:hypothetical protein